MSYITDATSNLTQKLLNRFICCFGLDTFLKTPYSLFYIFFLLYQVVRTAGGQVWEDVTLLDWPDDDFRMFCGDLGNDVTDELLVSILYLFYSWH